MFLFVDSSDQNVWKHPGWMRKWIQNLPATILLRCVTVNFQTNVSLKSSHEGTYISFFIFLCFVWSHMFDVSRWEGWNLPFWVWAKRVGFGSENQWISRLFCQICACATRFLFRKVCSQLPGQSDVRTRVKLHSVNTIVEIFVFVAFKYLLRNIKFTSLPVAGYLSTGNCEATAKWSASTCPLPLFRVQSFP